MLERAQEKARLLPYIKGKHRVYAIVTDKKGRILSESSNSYEKSSPHMKRFAESVNMQEKIYWHAECKALHYLPQKSNPYKITIARVGRSGDILRSAPCPICEKAIKEKGIKAIEYGI